MILKLVLRNLRKHPFLNLIKLAGLMFAFSSMMLIALYLKHELSYDRLFTSSDRIYRFTAASPSKRPQNTKTAMASPRKNAVAETPGIETGAGNPKHLKSSMDCIQTQHRPSLQIFSGGCPN